MLYLNSDTERQPYEIEISSDQFLRRKVSGELVRTGPSGWIFVLKHNRLFGCEKRTATYPRLQHSSFFSGEPVNAAGMIVCIDGALTTLFPHSGHYRPLETHLCSLLSFLRDRGLALEAFQVVFSAVSAIDMGLLICVLPGGCTTLTEILPTEG